MILSGIPSYGRRDTVCFVLLAALFEALCVWSIMNNSIMIDEYAHLPAGVAYWKDARFEMYDENPPLARYLVALPAVLMGAQMDYTAAEQAFRWEWRVSQDFRALNYKRYLLMFSLGRLTVTLVSVACGYILFKYARTRFGPGAGPLASALWFTDPNVIAHSSIASVDICSTAISLLATILFIDFASQPSRPKALGCGVALGLALGAKFSLLLLIPSWAAILLFRGKTGGSTGLKFADSLLHATVMVASSLLVLNSLYLFHGSFAPLGSHPFHSPLLTGIVPTEAGNIPSGNRFSGSWLGYFRVPIPSDYLRGLDSLLFEQQTFPIGAMVAGRLVPGGAWHGPFKAIFYKMPPGTLVLLAGLLLAIVRSQGRAGDRAADTHYYFCIIPFVFLAALCLQGSGMNSAFRYQLPALPFLILAIASSYATHRSRRYIGQFALACVIANLGSLSINFPNTISYANEFSGGPSRAQREFVGSNFDWGQDLLRLKAWSSSHPEHGPIAVAFYGAMPPGEVGIATRRPPASFFQGDKSLGGAPPQPFYWAISSNMINTLPGMIIGEHGQPEPVTDGLTTSPLGVIASEAIKPENAYDVVGGAIFIFRVAPGPRPSDGKNSIDPESLRWSIRPTTRSDIAGAP